ncbi:polyphosphate glucokinase [Motilibacter rhizosphaerae]|uniref:Polyphosphate glucokinase n=1 Tax=Motilibacter rhizosphaerae TaxID=598652 RepID=A0A4Q7NVZ2_9ACTN|nr:ROK family protein [Motilibacter rhizosphaerae]RZS91365.1 polyphosphate glucokinase [Motilibacter rhizosphaerae]
MPTASGARTLVVDCGGTGIKAGVLDQSGTLVTPRRRVETPYPCPTSVFVATIVELTREFGTWDRVSVGVPGVLRQGRVKHTPHFVTVAGPFSPQDPALVEEWRDFDVEAALAAALGAPVRAVNDAEMHGCAVIEGRGFEVVITLGTGFGFAMFEDGRLLPKIEMSAHLLRKGESYDERLGNLARARIGRERWNARVADAVYGLRWVLWWDRLYVGGGNARHLRVDLGADVTTVPNIAGLLGGIALWDGSSARLKGYAPRHSGELEPEPEPDL